MAEEEKISTPSTEECIETAFRELANRPNVSITYLETLEEAERRVKKHYERIRKLEAVVEKVKTMISKIYCPYGCTRTFAVEEEDLDAVKQAFANLEGEQA